MSDSRYAVESRAPMSADDKEMMLVHIFRCDDVFNIAMAMLTQKHFDRNSEAGYVLAWETACDFYKQHSKRPGKDILLTEIVRRLDQDRGFMVEEARADLQIFIDYAFDMVESTLFPKYGLELLQRFLEEREVDTLRRTLREAGTEVPTNFPRFIRAISDRCNRISNLQCDSSQAPVPLQYVAQSLNKHTTGLIPLDQMMNGGQACKEVYGILGPTGTGKTTLGLQIALEGCKYQQQIHPDGVGIGYWYFFTYEAPVDPELRLRLLSYAATIDRSRLEGLPDWDNTLSRDVIQDYEKAEYAFMLQSGSPVPTEHSRYREALGWINRNFLFFDMTGAEDPTTGTGGVAEIVGMLDYQSRVLGRRIGGVVIDYAGEMVDKYLVANGISFNDKRHYLSRAGADLSSQVASRFDCPVWLLHQLAGAENTKTSTRVANHSNAAECKSFANPLWFNFVFGSLDKVSSCCVLSCSKQRRAAARPDIILKLDGQFGRFVATGDNYSLDHVTKRIVRVDEVAALDDTPAIPGARKRPSKVYGVIE